MNAGSSRRLNTDDRSIERIGVELRQADSLGAAPHDRRRWHHCNAPNPPRSDAQKNQEHPAGPRRTGECSAILPVYPAQLQSSCGQLEHVRRTLCWTTKYRSFFFRCRARRNLSDVADSSFTWGIIWHDHRKLCRFSGQVQYTLLGRTVYTCDYDFTTSARTTNIVLLMPVIHSSPLLTLALREVRPKPKPRSGLA